MLSFARRRNAAGHIVLPEPRRCSQCQAAIFIQLLAAGPTHRISLPFHFNLRFQPQAFPLRALGQRKLRLSNLSRQRISRIQTASDDDFSVGARDRDSQNSRHAGDPIIRKSNDQSRISAFFISPYPRRTHAVADTPRQRINRIRILMVVIRECDPPGCDANSTARNSWRRHPAHAARRCPYN